ncbi:MAG: right-handed parallel beta-helix repeat-containing protein [Actinomycetota bacterium]|nr:right-handed parallel beta-helix repeat-containing protein [Actinomycetota bacterium]
MQTRALALVLGLVLIAVSCAETPGDTPVSPPTDDATTTTLVTGDDADDDTTTTTAAPTTTTEAPATTTTAAPTTTTAAPTTTTTAPDNVGTASDGKFPSAATTGVPTGTNLTPRSGTITLSQAGQVLEGVDLNGCVKVTASNVVIRKSRITCDKASGTNAAIRQSGSASGLLIEDVEITGPSSNYAQAGIYSGNAYTVRRTEISGHDDGAFLGSGTVIEDSWIHSLAASPGAHNDTLQMVGGSDVTIRNNRLEHRRDQTSAIIIKSDLAPIDDVTIEGNYLAGGSFTVYVYAGKSSYGGCCDAPTNTRVVGNVVEAGSYLFGAMTIQGDAEVTCNTTSDGQPVTYYDSDRKTNPKVSACS